MKSIAAMAVLAVFARAQEGDDAFTQEDMNSLFDNQEEGMLISPAPMPADGEDEPSQTIGEVLTELVF